MSNILSAAVGTLSKKLGDATLQGSAKFIIENEGSLIVDAAGVRASEDEADVSLIADSETFQGILCGELNATSAFMSGRLSIEGDMRTAMQLASLLI